MGKVCLWATVLALASSAAFSQQQQIINREAMTNTREMGWGNHQTWMRSMANLDKLRANLAQAWQGMGMSPQASKMLADAFDPERAARIEPPSLRGKSNQEVAQMLQDALKQKRYMYADLVLIDYLKRNAKSAK